MERGRRKIWLVVILMALSAFNFIIWREVFAVSQSRFLKVFFFDIGQGSAVFLETPRRTQILVDGGPSAQILEKLNKTLPFFDRGIDLLVSTHPDADHLTGLVEILKSFQVDRFGWTGIKSQRPEFQEVFAETDRRRTEKIILKKGQKIFVGQGLRVEVLAPLEDFEDKTIKDANTSSLVLRVSWGQNTFLLTGDLPSSVEKKLVREGRKLNSQVLQVGHHGSANSSSDIFLEKVQPKLAVIQVGAKDDALGPACDNKERNRYGHPSCAVLERLKKYGIRILRTDEVGDIKFFSDGKDLKMQKEK